MTQKKTDQKNYLDLDSLITESPRITFHDGTAIVLREISTDEAMKLFSRARLIHRLPPAQRITAMADTVLTVAEEPEKAAALIDQMSAIDLLEVHHWLFNMETAEYSVKKPEVIGQVKMEGKTYEIRPITYGALKIALRASGQDPEFKNLSDKELFELNMQSLALIIGAPVDEIKALNYVKRNRLEAFLEKQLSDAMLQVVEMQRAEAQRGNVLRGL